jgi:hypothetical protein
VTRQGVGDSWIPRGERRSGHGRMIELDVPQWIDDIMPMICGILLYQSLNS